MRAAPGDRYDAGIVDHLVEDDHAIGVLKNLHVVVIRTRIHRRPRVEREASLAERSILRAVGWMLAPFRGARRRALLRGGGECRHAAVGWIDDERARMLAVDRGEPQAAVEPELVVRAAHVGLGRRAASIPIALLERPGLER